MFRFTIRDVLWLTVVVALGARWWMDRRRQSHFDGVMVVPNYMKAQVHSGQMLELRVLPNGELDGRAVPYRP